MPLQNFVDNSLPTVKAAWLNAIDSFYTTLFASATTAADARTAIDVPPNSRTVSGGAGLAGGGSLAADRTLTLDVGHVNAWTAAQRGTQVALTDGATITPDFAAANNFTVTLGGNRTLANPTNIVAGQSGVIQINQDGTGGRTLAFGSYWKFVGGTAPTLTTTASAMDELVYYVESATKISALLRADVK